MKRKLIVLDVDHTLLHTWHYSELAITMMNLDGTDSPYEEGFDDITYSKKLLKCFSNAFEWEENTVCPRPHLPEFSEQLLKLDTDIAIFSTGTRYYLEAVLPEVIPDLWKNTKFVWDRLFLSQQGSRKLKNMAKIQSELSYSIENIIMLDDSDIVTPWHNHLTITPFDVSPGKLDSALQDNALLRANRQITALQNIECMYALRKEENRQKKIWSANRLDWRWKESMKRAEHVELSEYPVPPPKSLNDRLADGEFDE